MAQIFVPDYPNLINTRKLGSEYHRLLCNSPNGGIIVDRIKLSQSSITYQ